MSWPVVAVVLLSLGVLVLALVSRRRQGRPLEPKAVASENSGEVDEFEDLNEKFLKNFSGGIVIKLVKTYQPEDYMLIRSILDGAGLLSYSEFETMNSLFPGVPIAGYSEAYISVPENDVAEARAIVAEYIEERREGLRNPSNPENLGGKIVQGYLDIQGFRGNLPELLVKG